MDADSIPRKVEIMFDNQPHELILIYHSEKPEDKKARGYVESLPTLVIKTIDLAVVSMTEAQLSLLADKIEIPIEELVDPTYDERPDTVNNHKELKQMDRTQILTMIKHNLKLLSTPILINGDRAYKYGSAFHL